MQTYRKLRYVSKDPGAAVITFKQLEALYWIVQLGGFSQAARKLHTTQSAISKRVQELEAAFDTTLFDRSHRSARLSDKGEEMLALARQLLDQRDAAVERFSQPAVMARRVRIGVTELTAMTWLPRLVQLVRQEYPRVIIEPDVDLSINLRDKMLSDRADLVIVPDAFSEAKLARQRLASVESCWMCKPGLLPARRRMTLQALAAHTILTQGGQSGTGIIYDRWLKSQAVTPANAISCNSLVALIGLTVSGLGVSYLPRRCMEGMIERRLLEVVRTVPALPEVPYVAMYRAEQRSSLVSSIVGLAQDACDFSRMFQAEQDA
jgi:DNA-binding transcriptional LysR family regulator